MNVLFFPGKNTPIKRYRSYFPMYNLLSPNEIIKDEIIQDKLIIICHSMGIVDAIKWCEDNKIIAKIMISIDGVCISQYSIDKCNIHLFRQFDKQFDNNYTDSNMYKSINYYMGGNHHPYEEKKIRNLIVKTISNLL